MLSAACLAAPEGVEPSPRHVFELGQLFGLTEPNQRPVLADRAGCALGAREEQGRADSRALLHDPVEDGSNRRADWDHLLSALLVGFRAPAVEPLARLASADRRSGGRRWPRAVVRCRVRPPVARGARTITRSCAGPTAAPSAPDPRPLEAFRNSPESIQAGARSFPRASAGRDKDRWRAMAGPIHLARRWPSDRPP